jgi:hypothetical protein
MTLLDYSADAGEFSESTAACPPGAAAFPELAPRTAAPRRVHPLTWVVAAALIPVLCWDAWRSLEEAKQRVHTHHGAAQLDAGAPAAFSVAQRGR